VIAPDVATLPVLWHLKASHYNEKARWALDHKRVPHIRRAVTPPRHRAIAPLLNAGRTFPVLVLDGVAIGDSTRIIEALERRYPEPPLYPADPDDRRRALELEEFFDEELGPDVRRIVFDALFADPELFLATLMPDLGGRRRRAALVGFPLLRAGFRAAFAIDEQTVDLGWERVHAACERFHTELGPRGYLVGGSFTVADLTLAALISPAVCPDQFPYPQPQRNHPLLAPLHELLAESGLLAWARQIYARHRGPSSEVAPQPGRTDRRIRGGG
jgi:glutathione S-transferase